MPLTTIVSAIVAVILIGWNVYQYVLSRKASTQRAKTLSDIKDTLDGFAKRLGPVDEANLDANPLRCQLHKESIDKLVTGQERVWRALDEIRDRIGVTEGDIKAIKVKCGLDV
jgi:hypothetical protein